MNYEKLMQLTSIKNCLKSLKMTKTIRQKFETVYNPLKSIEVNKLQAKSAVFSIFSYNVKKSSMN